MQTSISTFASLAALAATLIFSSCQTMSQDQRRAAEMKQVQLGMTKAEVLERVGGPAITRRSQGRDVWIYGHSDIATEIQIANGAVVALGTVDETKSSAAAQAADDANLNRAIAESENERHDQTLREESLAIARAGNSNSDLKVSAPRTKAELRFERRLHHSYYGTSFSDEEDRIAPEWQEIDAVE